ncbi:hypothetical protein Syun_009265 [Stephania yunnanensis]|uniref:Uncharacterized protein n=1 Tax=Stephania yunnanensis TaxID=152371 RepID=A0AAP0PS48_9MAGN
MAIAPPPSTALQHTSLCRRRLVSFEPSSPPLQLAHIHVDGDKAVRDHSVAVHNSKTGQFDYAHIHVDGDKAVRDHSVAVHNSKTGQFDYG